MFNRIKRISFNHLSVILSWSRRQLRRHEKKQILGIRVVSIIVLTLISLQLACYRSVQSNPPTVHSGEESASAAEASYFKDIEPILQAHCQACHQPGSSQGELILTDYQGFKNGGKSGPAFLPGDPEGSLVIAHLTGKREPRMPPGPSSLEETKIELFRLWIRKGAKDDTPM